MAIRYRYHDGWHEGELAAQQQLGFKDAVQFSFSVVEFEMDEVHRRFHSSLPFIALSSLDAEGRVWASLAAFDGNRGFAQALDRTTLSLRVRRCKGDPLVDNLSREADAHLVGGVGVELLNRRRNKFAGHLKSIAPDAKNSDTFQIKLSVNASLGNCPKYISVRELKPRDNSNADILCQNDQHPPSEQLPEAVIKHIQKADSLYLATAYLPKENPEQSGLGMNHRGGKPGFVRVDPRKKPIIYIADYSGNRFMQSIGNMLTYPKAGAVFPLFETGDVLYLTGDTNLYVGETAKKYMRGVHAVTAITVTGYRLVRGGLPFIQEGESVASLYNPPARPLLLEPESGHDGSSDGAVIQAHLHSCRFLSESIGVFTFRIEHNSKVKYTAGQHALIDCSMFLGAVGYKHMAARGQEKTLNDDGVRSWTVSNWREEEDTLMDITMRQKEDGSVTPIFFAFGQAVNERDNGKFEGPTALSFPLLGIAGGFVFDPTIKDQIWIAADGTSIRIILSCRSTEVDVFGQLIREAVAETSPPVSISLCVSDVADTSKLSIPSLSSDVSLSPGRINKSLLDNLSPQTEAFICGTAAFRTTVTDLLLEQGLPVEHVHYESFSY